MSPKQYERFELLANGDLEPETELEVLFMESAKLGASLSDPVTLYTALRDRFIELKSDEVEVMMIGYDTGIAAAQAAYLELEGMNEPGDTGGMH